MKRRVSRTIPRDLLTPPPAAPSPLSVAGRLLRCFALWFVAAALVLWLGTGLVWLSLERAVIIAAACTLAMAFAGL